MHAGAGATDGLTNMMALVLHCGNNGEFSTCFLRQCCVVISQRCHRIASFFRLALTQKSGTEIHRYFRNAVLEKYKWKKIGKNYKKWICQNKFL